MSSKLFVLNSDFYFINCKAFAQLAEFQIKDCFYQNHKNNLLRFFFVGPVSILQILKPFIICYYLLRSKELAFQIRNKPQLCGARVTAVRKSFVHVCLSWVVTRVWKYYLTTWLNNHHLFLTKNSTESTNSSLEIFLSSSWSSGDEETVEVWRNYGQFL